MVWGNNDRRMFWRASFNSPVQLVSNGEVIAADLHDISLKGALVTAPEGWSGCNGANCQLRLSLGPHAAISMTTVISHVEGRRIGLHCTDIDVDSATHLRRLVELNSGDPALLDRELSVLLQEAQG